MKIPFRRDPTIPAHSPIAKKPKSKKRRRALYIGGLLAACGLLPAGILQLSIYRSNLVVARENFPAGPIFKTSDRLFFLVPHCDDETLGAGGIIAAARARGLAVKIVFLTNGDGSLSTQIAQDARHLRRTTYRQMASMRQKEAIAALKELGVPRADIVFLGFPDGGAARLWQSNWSPQNLYKSPFTGTDRSPYANSFSPRAPYCGAQVLRDVTTLMAAFRPTAIFSTHPADTHLDHWAAYAFARAALESLRLQNPSRDWAQRAQMWTFLIHYGPWPAPHGFHPDANLSPPAELKNLGTRWQQIALDEKSRAAKAAALNCYVSQRAFTPQFLRAFLRRNELLGGVRASVESPAKNPVPLIQDPTRDSVVRNLWEAADIRSIATVPSGATIKVRLTLAHRASRKLTYRFSLHRVDGTGARAWLVDVRHAGKDFVATARQDNAKQSQTWPARRVTSGLEMDVPRAALGLKNRPSTLLISATSLLGTRILDQSETGTLRLAK